MSEDKKKAQNLKTGKSNHNNPYATQFQLQVNTLALCEAFRTVYTHGGYFYGKKMSLRNFQTLTGISQKTLWRIIHKKAQCLTPENYDRLKSFLNQPKFNLVLQFAQRNTIVVERKENSKGIFHFYKRPKGIKTRKMRKKPLFEGGGIP